jgi:hypothetical protein
LWATVEPRRYRYRIEAAGLVQAFALAMVARLSGLRAVAERCGHFVGTKNFASLPEALKRASSLRFVQAMLERLQAGPEPGDGALVAIDSMALTLPKTRRHHCAKFNNKTVGGGVLWTYVIDSARGVCPVKILRIMSGAWHDTKTIRGARLIARGPIYLMDRGFYALDLVEQWLEQKVRFVVRVKHDRDLVYEPVRTMGCPRRHGNLWIVFDGIAKLGAAQAKHHPRVRLIIARPLKGKELTLASDRYDWSAAKILAAYKKRWHIERFHRFVKEALGLAHLYSFDHAGMMFLLHTALLTALLLFFEAESKEGEAVIAVLRQMLALARKPLGLGALWRRNMVVRGGYKSKRKTGENVIQ